MRIPYHTIGYEGYDRPVRITGVNGNRVSYEYNADGNLNMDTSRSISGIGYSPSGMPVSVDIFGDDRFEYSYDAAGRKLAESYLPAGGPSTTTRYYVGALELLREATDSVPRLIRVNLPWGYLDAGRIGPRLHPRPSGQHPCRHRP